jgi:hypothetical protein
MVESSILKIEILSYLATKVEHYSSDTCFKAKNLTFIGRSTQAIGRVCGMLTEDGLIVKDNRTHTPSVWRTNLMNGGIE